MGSLLIHIGPSYERPAGRMNSSISFYAALKLIASYLKNVTPLTFEIIFNVKNLY